MQVKIDKQDIIVSFEKDFSDVIDFLGAKKGIINTTVPFLYNGSWTYLLYEIAYYELDLEHTYTTYELDTLVKTGKVVLLSSRPYFCTKENENTREEDRYAEKYLTTLNGYNSYMLSRNSEVNNKLVLEMLKKFNEKLNNLYNLKKEKMKIK